MKYLLVLALCFTSAVVMSEGCKSNDDCDEDECCVSYIFNSMCKSRLDESQGCNIFERLGQKKHVGMCPCKTGMKCENTKKTIFGMEYDPRCVKTEEPEPKTKEPEPKTTEPEPEPKETEPEPEEPEAEA